VTVDLITQMAIKRLNGQVTYTAWICWTKRGPSLAEQSGKVGDIMTLLRIFHVMFWAVVNSSLQPQEENTTHRQGEENSVIITFYFSVTKLPILQLCLCSRVWPFHPLLPITPGSEAWLSPSLPSHPWHLLPDPHPPCSYLSRQVSKLDSHLLFLFIQAPELSLRPSLLVLLS
jgi:hypothetical protein